MIPGMAGFPGRQSQSMLMILPFLGHRIVSAAQARAFQPQSVRMAFPFDHDAGIRHIPYRVVFYTWYQ